MIDYSPLWKTMENNGRKESITIYPFEKGC